MSGSLFGPTSPKGGGAGGGGGSALRVEDEGVLVDANVSTIDFTGVGVTATSTGAGTVDVNVPGPTSQGFWAGAVPAVSFAGAPLKATVAFGSPHPAGLSYAVATDEVVIGGSGLSLDITIENKTVNGFDIVLNTAGPLPNLIQVDWQVQPHGVAVGPTGIVSLPGIQNILIVDQGSNLTQNGTQQFPFHSIQAALAVATFGDVVQVYPGTYVEQITPITGVTVRGIDQARCVLQNPGNNPADAPIATVANRDMLLENMTVQATGAGGLVHQLGSSQQTSFKDCLVSGQLDLANNGAVLTLERNVIMTGQVLVSGGDSTTELKALDAHITGSASLGVPLVIADADPQMHLRRCELYGAAGNEAIQWQAQNDNLELEWCRVDHGDGDGNHPFDRTGSETPTYAGHHNRYTLAPEQGGIWSNSYPYGQRFDTPDEQSFAAANNQAAPADVVGLVFDATVRSVKVHLSVYVNATTPLVEVFEMMIVRRGATWLITSSTTGDTTGLSFTITNGQVQYTSTNVAGWVSTDIRFISKVTGV